MNNDNKSENIKMADLSSLAKEKLIENVKGMGDIEQATILSALPYEKIWNEIRYRVNSDIDFRDKIIVTVAGELDEETIQNNHNIASILESAEEFSKELYNFKKNIINIISVGEDWDNDQNS